jgi:uncharacterized membrane protein YbhN (UPF0104 family)
MQTRKSKWLDLLALCIFSLSLLLIYRQLRHYRFHDIIESFLLIAPSRLALSALFTLLNYLVVSAYDVLAFRHFGVSLPLKNVLLAAFIGDATSNVVGYSMFSGGAVRYRLHAAWNVSLAMMGKVMVFISLMLWIGIFAVGSVALIVEPRVVAAALHFPPAALQLGGLVLLALVAGYVLFSLAVRRPLCLWKWEVHMPTFGNSLGQVLISSADWLFAALALYVLLPQPAVPFLVFLAVYLPAQFLGIISQVPGGLGVFETILLLVVPSSHNVPGVLAALLAFRVIYYLLPFGTALVLLGVQTAHGENSLQKGG